MRLKDKVAIITGATSGIGKATALRFAEEGAALVITGRRAGLGTAAEAEIRQRGARCVFVEADHTKEADCQRVVDSALEEFGRIDILFNNAGIVPKGTAEETTEESWQKTLDINITAVWRMSTHALSRRSSALFRRSAAIANRALSAPPRDRLMFTTNSIRFRS